MPTQKFEVMDFDSSWPGKSWGAPDPRLGTVDTSTTVPVVETTVSPSPEFDILAPTASAAATENISATAALPDENFVSTTAPESAMLTSIQEDRLNAVPITSPEDAMLTSTQDNAANSVPMTAPEDAMVTGTSDTVTGESSIPRYTVSDNVLLNYATYTYSLSLHALSPSDYSKIMGNPDEDFVPSAVLISSAGRYGSDIGMVRHSEFQSVDFFFDNLSIETVIGMTAQNRNTNAISCSFTIIEPYGVTLLNRIIAVCDSIGGANFREMPYLLQIDFFGTTDQGDNAGVPEKIPGISKLIPIRLGEVKIKLSTKGAEYAVTAFPFNHTAYTETIASSPIKLEVVAATVGEFFLAKTGIPDSLLHDAGSIYDSKVVQEKRNANEALTAMAAQIRADRAKASEGSEDEQTARLARSNEQTRNYADEEEILKKISSAAIKVHSYTGAINAWYSSLKKDKKIEQNHVIAFEIAPEIANASFPDSKFIPPSVLPMAFSNAEADVAIAQSVKENQAKSSEEAADKTAQQRNSAPPFLANSAATTQATSASTSNSEAEKLAVQKSENDQSGTFTKIYSGDSRTRVIPINQGTSIMEVIGLAIRSSSFITSQLANVVDLTADPQKLADLHKKALTWFKITPRVELLAWDKTQNQYAKKITYVITPYIVYNTKESTAPLATPEGFVKEYNYMYTGENRDIINLDINFDTLYYVAQSAHAVNKEEVSAAPTTVSDSDALKQDAATTQAEDNNATNSEANPAMQTGKVPVPQQANISGMTNKDDKGQQMQKQLLTSPGGDMLSIKLKIVGDPDFIKQDDCFYSTPTLKKSRETLFKFKNGSLVMDLGEIFVNLTFKTPGDYDDLTGLARPGYESYNSSIFSGRYRVLTVKNTFSGGKFEQELDLVYYPNQKTQGVKDKAKPTAKELRLTSSTMQDTRVDLSTFESSTTSFTFNDATISSYYEAEVISEGASSTYSGINWLAGESSNLTESFNTNIGILKNQFKAMPTFSLGEDFMSQTQSAIAAASANASEVASEIQNGFAKIPAGNAAGATGIQSTLGVAINGVLPSIPNPASNVQTAITSAQSAVGTAAGQVS